MEQASSKGILDKKVVNISREVGMLQNGDGFRRE
jgi:hypothetical protein